MTDRTDYTSGLRDLAQWLDDNPDVPLPHEGTTSELLLFVSPYRVGGEQNVKPALATIARAMGTAVKEYEEDANYGFRLRGKLFGLPVLALAPRDAVCVRVVKGTRTVETQVPVAPVEYRTETVEVEDVEWVCDGSILAAAEATP